MDDEIRPFITNQRSALEQKNCLTQEEMSTLHAVIHDIDEKGCKQIWKHIQNLQGPQAHPEADTSEQSVFLPLLDIEISTSMWELLQKTSVKRISWSVRTQNVIAQKGLQTLAELVQYSSTEWLRFRNFGRTSLVELKERVTKFITHPIHFDETDNTEMPSTQTIPQDGQLEIPLQPCPKNQSVFLPLLNTEVSTSMWELLQKTSVKRILWSVRTQNVINRQGLQTLAELVQYSPTEWLRFRNFGRTSLVELKERITEFITHPIHFDETDDTETPCPQTTSEDGEPDTQSQEHSENQPVFLPLLKIEVSASMWKLLQKTPIKGIPWSVRMQNVIAREGLQTFADLVQLSRTEWLRFRNFGRTSLTELQKRITEFVTNPPQLDKTEETEMPSTQPYKVEILKTEVSTETWEILENAPIHQFTWPTRIENAIRKKGIKTLAELAAVPPAEWLKLKNFGRGSWSEIQEKIREIIEKSDSLGGTTTSPIETLSELSHAILQHLSLREQEVVKRYYGYEQVPENLRQIGEAIEVSHERIRQIKQAANQKINQGTENHLFTTTICKLFSESICDALASRNGFCGITELRDVISQTLGWGEAERWIVNWFDEAFGDDWLCLGTELYEVVDGICYLKSDYNNQDFFAQLAMNLQRYGYRPLTGAECKTLYQQTGAPALDSTQLLDALEHHQSFKIYQYGQTYIGLSEWAWFAPEQTTTVKGKANLVEWYLRVTCEPATPKAIADGIWEKLGNFGLTAMDVVDVLEKQPARFHASDNNTYGLYVRDEVSGYCHQILTEVLSDGPLPIAQIVDRLSVQGPEVTKGIVATLNFYKDSFVEPSAFEWALRSNKDEIEEQTDFDYTNLTFEDLIPKG